MSNAGQTTSAAAFRTTVWTEVLGAAKCDSELSNSAFAQLYQDYWPPLYAYVRRRGYSPAESEDLTQSFFVALLEKSGLARVTRAGGKFRAFLLTSLKHHLSDEWDRARAAKRGGGVPVLSLDVATMEQHFQLEPSGNEPELDYERDWALAVMDVALRRLEDEMRLAGREKFYTCASPHLQGDRNGRPYGELASELGISESALRVAVHRLRRRYGELLRDEVARTVGEGADAAEELRYLREIVERRG